MNENIDLTKILENCPEGWEFWSDNYGKVRFKCINKSYEQPIFVKRTDGYLVSYTKEGCYCSDFPGSCILWPSRDQRDWSKFTALWYKKEKFNPEKFDPKTLKPFDKVLTRDLVYEEWTCTLFSYRRNDRYSFICGDKPLIYCIPYNDDTKHLVGTDKEAPEYYRFWED